MLLYEILLFVVIYANSGCEGIESECLFDQNTPGIIEGKIILTQEDENANISIQVNITKLAAGEHGFHVHENGDLSNVQNSSTNYYRVKTDCMSAGGHFNPKNETHGGPDDAIRHVGDLGNIVAGSDGAVNTMITDRQVKLSGPNNVAGLAFVIHKGKDDLGKGGAPSSNTTGNAGGRISCCIISTPSVSATNRLIPALILLVIGLACSMELEIKN